MLSVEHASVEGQSQFRDFADREFTVHYHGLSMIRLTPTMASSGWLMMAANPSAPKTFVRVADRGDHKSAVRLGHEA